MHSDVVDDVLLHDLDLVLRIVGNDPVTAIDVDASSWAPGRPGPEAVRCHLTFSGGTEVDMQASRVADRRERRLCATFGSASISVDLLNARNNALAAQLQHLIELVRTGTASTRAAERESVLPAHELARRIGELIQVSTCGR